MITVTKIFEFEAAHSLPNYDGVCNSLHGHGYKLEITVEGDVGVESGMIMDFKELKDVVQNRVIGLLDHQLLNDHLENPTAERLVEFIRGRLTDSFDFGCELVGIRLWETSNSHCDWIKD